MELLRADFLRRVRISPLIRRPKRNMVAGSGLLSVWIFSAYDKPGQHQSWCKLLSSKDLGPGGSVRGTCRNPMSATVPVFLCHKYSTIFPFPRNSQCIQERITEIYFIREPACAPGSFRNKKSSNQIKGKKFLIYV